MKRKYQARGTAFDPVYNSERVRSIQQRAVKTMLGFKEGRYRSEVEAAQDVLDLLYTAMLFGLFKDYKPQSASKVDFL